MKESKTLEFKSGKTSSFLKTVSAYANYGVGTIEFGRQDNGEIKGIDNANKRPADLFLCKTECIHQTFIRCSFNTFFCIIRSHLNQPPNIFFHKYRSLLK